MMINIELFNKYLKQFGLQEVATLSIVIQYGIENFYGEFTYLRLSNGPTFSIHNPLIDNETFFVDRNLRKLINNYIINPCCVFDLISIEELSQKRYDITKLLEIRR